MRSAANYAPTFAKRKAPVEEPQQEITTNCAAHGCPRKGELSNDTGPTSRFLCWVHYEAKEPMDWPRLTQAINENLWLVEFADKLAKKSSFDLECASKEHRAEGPEIDRWLKSNGLDELCRQTMIVMGKERPEPLAYWIPRVRGYVLWVLKGSDPEKKPGSKRFEPPWAKA